MKIKDNFMLRKVADSFVVVPIGSAVADFNGMVNLNEAGAFLWQLLEKGSTEQEMLSAMLEKYDVDESVAANDISRFVNEVKEAGLLE